MNYSRIRELMRMGCVDPFACAVYDKKDSDPPDYTPMAQASEKSAQIMADLGEKQLAFARQQYDEMKPLLSQIADSQVAAQDEQLRQARDYYDYQQSTFKPLEIGLVKDAEKFNTDDYREQLASKAAADTGAAMTATQRASERAMASMGVNPNSGRFAGMKSANDISIAAQRANAMTGTRQQAEQLGWAKRMDAAGLGRGLSGASLGAYSGSVGAGGAAGASYQMPGNSYLAGMGQGANTIYQGRGLLQSGLGNVLQAQTSVYGAQQQAAAGDAMGLGNAIGSIGSAYLM